MSINFGFLSLLKRNVCKNKSRKKTFVYYSEQDFYIGYFLNRFFLEMLIHSKEEQANYALSLGKR